MVTQETVIIYLHREDMSSPSWAVTTQAGEVTHYALHDSAPEWHTLTEKRRIVVIVPGEAVLLTSVEMPTISRARLRQAIPYALEDSLIADVETLHFAIGKTDEAGLLSVAVVAHDTMRAWLAMLYEWGVKPDVFVPSSLALPYQAGSWQISIADEADIRTGETQGFVCHKDAVEPWILQALSVAIIKPQCLKISSLVKPLGLIFGETISVEETVQTEEARLKACAMAVQVPPINLLQAPYESRSKSSAQFSQGWHYASYLAALWLALLMLYPMVSYFIFKHAALRSDHKIAALYHHYFPEKTSALLSNKRMSEKLQQLTEVGSETFFMGLLTKVAMAIKQESGIVMRHLEYQHHQLIIELTASTSQSLSRFTEALSQQGLLVKQQNASLMGDQLKASLVIS